jgi:hypothetical protein
MKKQQPAKQPVLVKYDKRVNDIKVEGAFQGKVDKVNHILKTAGLPKTAAGK